MSDYRVRFEELAGEYLKQVQDAGIDVEVLEGATSMVVKYEKELEWPPEPEPAPLAEGETAPETSQDKEPKPRIWFRKTFVIAKGLIDEKQTENFNQLINLPNPLYSGEFSETIH